MNHLFAHQASCQLVAAPREYLVVRKVLQMSAATQVDGRYVSKRGRLNHLSERIICFDFLSLLQAQESSEQEAILYQEVHNNYEEHSSDVEQVVSYILRNITWLLALLF